jgi:opacity protein-like surface antigen
MKRLIPLLFLALLLFPMTGMASEGGYLFLSAGIDRLEEKLDIPVYFSGFDVSAEADTGYLLSFGAGFHLSENVRVEGEISYRSQEIGSVEATHMAVTGIGMDDGSGKITSSAAMVNAWIDFPLLPYLTPYFGGGIGAVQTRVGDFSIITYPVVPNPDETRTTLLDEADWQMAYQVGGGIGFELSEGVVIDMGCRYFGTADPEFTDEGGNKVSFSQRHSDFLLSLRYHF